LDGVYCRLLGMKAEVLEKAEESSISAKSALEAVYSILAHLIGVM
jgi:hypothetical protein